MFQSITLFGHKIALYSFFNNFSFVAQLVLLMLTIEEYRQIGTLSNAAAKRFIRKENPGYFRKYAFTFLEMILATCVLTTINNLSGPVISSIFLGTKDANYFPNIFVSPITAVLLCYLAKVSPLKALDYASLFAVVALICYKIACYCQGCCYGIEYGSTFYNYTNNRYEVPIQLIELGCAIVMFIILLAMRKHRKRPGLMYPVFILMYCGSRFITDFLRDDYPHIWGRLTGYHIQCIVGLVLGAVYLTIVLKCGEKITENIEAKRQAYLDKKYEEYKYPGRRRVVKLAAKKKRH